MLDLEKKTRESKEQAQDAGTLKGKLDNCKELFDRLEFSKRWKIRVNVHLVVHGTL